MLALLCVGHHDRPDLQRQLTLVTTYISVCSKGMMTCRMSSLSAWKTGSHGHLLVWGPRGGGWEDLGAERGGIHSRQGVGESTKPDPPPPPPRGGSLSSAFAKRLCSEQRHFRRSLNDLGGVPNACISAYRYCLSLQVGGFSIYGPWGGEAKSGERTGIKIKKISLTEASRRGTRLVNLLLVVHK